MILKQKKFSLNLLGVTINRLGAQKKRGRYLIELGDVAKAKEIVKKGIELAVLLNKEKVKSELNQLFELYFD